MTALARRRSQVASFSNFTKDSRKNIEILSSPPTRNEIEKERKRIRERLFLQIIRVPNLDEFHFTENDSPEKKKRKKG